MIKIAKELVETVIGRQKLIEIAEVVLAELARHVAQGLEQLGQGRVFFLQAFFTSGHTNFKKSSTDR